MKNQTKKIISTVMLPLFLISGAKYSYAADLAIDARGQVQPVVSLEQAETRLNNAPLQAPKNAFEEGPLSAPVVQEMTIHVQVGESIQAAIDAASAGNTVFIHAGIYHEQITLKKGVNLVGENRETTILDGQSRFRDVILASGDNSIESLTITGGAAYSEGPRSAIRIEGNNVHIKMNVITENADYGIYVRSGEFALIENNLFTDNHLGIQLPKDTTTIRQNTFVSQTIAINILGGATPHVEYNIFSGNTHSSIYEYAAGQIPSRGYAVVENNIFWNNRERGSAYGSATPPSVENQTSGNLFADPKFVDPASNDYRLQPGSLAIGKGNYPDPVIPEGWTRAESNPNYAFKKNINYSCSLPECREGQLLMMDLTMGAAVSLQSFSGRDAFVRDYDVDSEGNVFYVYSPNPSSGSLETYNFSTGQRHSNSATFYYQYGTFELVDGLIKVTYPAFMGYEDRYFDPKTAEQVPDSLKIAPAMVSGQFQAGACVNPTYSTSVAYTSCFGTIQTPNGTREIHTYNGRGNTGITIYDIATGASKSISIPTIGALSADSFSKDGKYLAVGHSLNRVTVVNLETMTTAGSVLIPEWSGAEPHGAPKVDRVRAESDTQFYIHVNDSQIPTVIPLEREFQLTVKSDSNLVLTEKLPALEPGQFQAGKCLGADYKTSAASTSCVGLIGTPSGTVEVHSYDQRGNTGITIYDSYQSQVKSISLPGWGGTVNQGDISSDGRYLTVLHGVNQVTVINLETGEAKPLLPILPVGKFVQGGCLVPNQSTSVSSTACVGLVGTPNGTVEVHTYNARGNTGVTIYDNYQRKILNYGVASLISSITQTSISPDGKYLTVVGQLNRVSVLSLVVPASQQSVLIPQADGAGAPLVDQAKFVSATRILVTMQDGTNRRFYVDIQPSGTLLLSQAPPSVPEGWSVARSNYNYAFQIQTSGQNQNLVMKDLLTGRDTLVYSAAWPYQIAPFFDVSPNGKNLIYGVIGLRGRASTFVQSIANLAQKTAVSFQTLRVLYIGDYVILIGRGQIKIISGRTLRAIF